VQYLDQHALCRQTLYGLLMQVTCSSGGTCNGTRSSLTSMLERISVTCITGDKLCLGTGRRTLPASMLVVGPANLPPTIRLPWSLIVSVRRGTPYPPCARGVSPTAEAPCEPGAIASDPDGDMNHSPLNLTPQVVVCPPAECLSKGCSPSVLQSNFFDVKGLAGCGVDTWAKEGTQFTIPFWVWDVGTPTRNATVSRTVVITSACPSATAPNQCTDRTGKSFCSGG